MISTPHDDEVRRLRRELNEALRKQRAARSCTAPKPKWAKRTVRKPRRPADVEAYWATLREMGCVVTGRTDRITIHHTHSGSMAAAGINRGGAEKTSDWLCIPLVDELHSIGPEAIDGAKGVLSWEAEYGRQVDHINTLVARTGIDVWRLAGVRRPE